jgi:hypothetical protein
MYAGAYQRLGVAADRPRPCGAHQQRIRVEGSAADVQHSRAGDIASVSAQPGDKLLPARSHLGRVPPVVPEEAQS